MPERRVATAISTYPEAPYVHRRLDRARPDRRIYRQQDSHQSSQGFWINIALGIIGALVGGFLFEGLGAQGITGFNVSSMIVAIIGSIVVLLIYHAVTGRRRA